MTLLTIAIPTYDRNAILAANLAVLLPQIGARARLLILDNQSPTPVEETLRPLLAQHPAVDVRIVRHPRNVGGNANIARCFELADSAWVWTLGDDDTPVPDALDRVLAHLAQYPDAVFLNFYGPLDSEAYERPATFVTDGRLEFLQRLDSLGNALFMSNCVYRLAPLATSLPLAFHYAFAMAPHLALLLAALAPGGVSCFSHEEILFPRQELAPEQQFSNVNVGLGIPMLLDLPMSSRERDALRLRIVHATRNWVTPTNLFAQCVLESVHGLDARAARYPYEECWTRLFRHDPHVGRRLIAFGLRVLLRLPRLSYRLLSVAYPLLRGSRFDVGFAPARFARM